MEKVYFKRVFMPIIVALGVYCFGEGRHCEHFDNEGGTPTCRFDFYPLKRDKEGRILKPKECLNL